MTIPPIPISSRKLGVAKPTLLFALLIVVLAGCLVFADWWTAYPSGAQASYVGRSRCIDCHQTQVTQWTGSDHDLAMDHANEQTVLGNFDNATLENHGITSTMFRRDGKFFVNTEGPDGQLSDFEVKYVFGFEPLQQYMVEFDRTSDQPAHEIAKLQVLRISWDTEKKTWFYLAPPDVKEKLEPSDPLHWTKSGQNWNHMCASCHSTGLEKNFDVATKTYHTTYSEIDVSCETCHGPASHHVELAESRSLFWDRNLGYGLKQLKSDDAKIEIESCAPCHSRRRAVYPDDPPGQDYYDCFSNELLAPTTYYPDGQILDEVYVYGSFLQSKMFHKGIRCSDCHDPHTTKLKLEGNKLCVSCHDAHPAGKYDTPNHHHHAMDSEGAKCASCHMPQSPYMEVDFRADHSIRVPRPDLSVDLNTPNACTQCHLELKHVDEEKHAKLPHYAAWMNLRREGDAQVTAELKRVDAWAANLCDEWYPNKYGKQDHFAYSLAKGWNQDISSVDDLYDIARLKRDPSIIRASALSQLSQLDPTRAQQLASRLLDDQDPQVRTAATMTMQAAPLRQRIELVTPLLQDPIRSVRIEAARVLADLGRDAFTGTDLQRRDKGIEQYQRGLQEQGDLAMSHMGLALLSERQRNPGSAIQNYRNAIAVQPDVTGPRTNLAALYEQLSRQVQPGSPQHSNTLREIQQLRAGELKLLARDAELANESAPIQYRYGLALYLGGQLEEALSAMERACLLEPRGEEFRMGLTLLLERLGKQQAAIESVDRLIQMAPANRTYQDIKRRILQPSTRP